MTTTINYVDTIMGFDQDAPLAHIHVGARDVCNSVEAQILVSRDVDGSSSTNSHAFSDSSGITRSSNIGYNSYDARVNISGSASFDHYVAFQSLPSYGSSGTMTNLYGLYAGLTVSAGTITNFHGMTVENPTGAGTVTNNYGVYIENLTKGATSNYAIYTAGTTKSFFGGNVGFGQTAPTNKVHISDTGALNLQITNDSSGHSSTDGLLVGIDSNNKYHIKAQDATDIIFYTNNTERGRIDNANEYLDWVKELRCRSLVLDGDSGNWGAGTTTLTNATSAIVDSNNAVVRHTTSGAKNAGWIKVYVGTTPAYIPYWTSV